MSEKNIFDLLTISLTLIIPLFLKVKHRKWYALGWLLLVFLAICFYPNEIYSRFFPKNNTPPSIVIDPIQQPSQIIDTPLTNPQTNRKDTLNLDIKSSIEGLKKNSSKSTRKAILKLYHINYRVYYNFQDIKKVVTSDNELLSPIKTGNKNYFDVLAPENYYGKEIKIEYLNSEEPHYETLK